MSTFTDGTAPSVAPEPEREPGFHAERPDHCQEGEEPDAAGSLWLREEIKRRIAAGSTGTVGRHARRDSVEPGMDPPGYAPRHSAPGAPAPSSSIGGPSLPPGLDAGRPGRDRSPELPPRSARLQPVPPTAWPPQRIDPADDRGRPATGHGPASAPALPVRRRPVPGDPAAPVEAGPSPVSLPTPAVGPWSPDAPIRPRPLRQPPPVLPGPPAVLPPPAPPAVLWSAQAPPPVQESLFATPPHGGVAVPRPRVGDPAAGLPPITDGDTTESDAASRRVRVVLAERKGVARPVRTVVDVQEGTAVGDLLRSNLIGSQLAVALRFAVVAGLTLGILPLLFAVFPEIGRIEVLGLRLPWLLLGVLVYPFLFGLGLWHTRTAERVEKNFADHVQD